ncbi:MAG: DUF4173 domain-containing protein [Puniceicoccaceae bacterium]
MQLEPENRVLGDLESGTGRIPGVETNPAVATGTGLRGLLLIGAGIVAGDWTLLYHRAGAGVGIFFLVLLGMVWLRRGEQRPTGPGVLLLLGLYLASAVQSAVFTSFSNGVVLLALLLVLSGEWGSAGWENRWQNWLEGMLSPLRPLGAYLQARQQFEEAEDGRSGRIREAVWILVPVVVLLLVFIPLLSGGNAILGMWTELLLRSIHLPHLGDLICWGMLGILGLVLVYPAGRTRLAGHLGGTWRQLGRGTVILRRRQWLAILMALNLLFLFSNILDVLYLWFSQELPAGVTYSQYVHKGVYALIMTTVLSALILGLLTQHADAVRKNALIRVLGMTWIGQNLLLISGVFVRLALYVDAYGYTPKRVYVALFLGLVIGGFAALAWAIVRLRDLKWLTGVNLGLVFLLFTVIQFVDVRGLVAYQNRELYAAGKIAYPEWDYLWQIGSHSVVSILGVLESPQTEADREAAAALLADQENLVRSFPSLKAEKAWQSFQLRDVRNRALYEEYLETLALPKQN